jgi:hypothetical protein
LISWAGISQSRSCGRTKETHHYPTHLSNKLRAIHNKSSNRWLLMEISGELIGEFRTAVGSDVSNSLGDDDCIRFLRARNGNITKASAMATTWYEWWHTSLSGSNAEDLTPATILTQIDYQWDSVMKEYCPHSFEGWDKLGRPIYWVCFPFPPPLLS